MAQDELRKAVALPQELWSRIATFAQRSDVSTLSKTCRLLESAAQVILYQDVILSGKKGGDAQATLDRLADRNWGTGKIVTSLTLQELKDIKFSNVPFENMSNILSLSVIKCPSLWKTSDEQNQFLAQIKFACPQLRRLNVQIQRPNPDDEFSIPNLTHVTWIERDLSSSIVSLCVASRETITHLSIHFVDCRESLAVEKFLKLHFPSLSSLELGPGHPIYQDADQIIDRSVGVFLSRHSTITHLRFIYELSDEYPDIYLSPYDIPRSVLPRLEYLAGHPEVISSCLNERVDFFHQSLRTLAIEDGLWLLLDDQLNMLFSDCVAYKKAAGKPLSVHHIRLMLRDTANAELRFSSDTLENWTTLAAEAFPNLETWAGDIPDENISVNDLIRIFSKIPRLRELSMYSSETFGYGEGETYPQLNYQPKNEAKNEANSKLRNKDNDSNSRTLHGDMIALAMACPAIEVIKVGSADHKVRDVCYVSRGTGGLQIRCVTGDEVTYNN